MAGSLGGKCQSPRRGLPRSPGPRNAPLHHIPTSRPQGLRREIQAHGPRLEEVLERAGALASLRSPEAEAVRRGQEQLQGAWAGLREAAERRQQVLDAAFQVEQYYFDVAEVEAWLGEQELLMMSEDKGKVRPGWGCGGPGGAGAGGRPLPPHRGRGVPPGRTEHPTAAQEAPAAGAGSGELRGKHRAAVSPVPGAVGDGAPGQVSGWGGGIGARQGRGQFLRNGREGSEASLLETGTRPSWTLEREGRSLPGAGALGFQHVGGAANGGAVPRDVGR